MAKTSSMYIRIDPEVKADVERIYSKFGMSITDAINVFLYQSRNIGGLPFDLRPSVQKEFTSPGRVKGILGKYANPALVAAEKGAWNKALEQKHDNI